MGKTEQRLAELEGLVARVASELPLRQADREAILELALAEGGKLKRRIDFRQASKANREANRKGAVLMAVSFRVDRDEEIARELN